MSQAAVRWALYGVDVEPGLRLTLVALADRASVEGMAWPSTSTLAVVLGKTRRQVRRDLAALVAAGVLERVPDREAPGAWYALRPDRRPTVYKCGPTVDRSAQRVDNVPRRGDMGDPSVIHRGDMGDRDGGTWVSPKPRTEPKERISYVRKSPAAPASVDNCEHGDPRGWLACALCRVARSGT